MEFLCYMFDISMAILIRMFLTKKKSFIAKSLEKHLICASSLDFYLLWGRKADLTVPTEQNMRFN